MNIKPLYFLIILSLFSSTICAQDVISDVWSSGNSQRHLLKKIDNQNYLIKIDLLDSVFVYVIENGTAELRGKTHILGAYTDYNLTMWNKWILAKDIEGSTAYNFVENFSEVIKYEEPYERSSWRIINEDVLVLSQYDDSNAERRAFLIDEEFDHQENIEYGRIYASDEDYLYYRMYENETNEYQKRDKENNEIISSFTIQNAVIQRRIDNYIYYYEDESNSVIRHDLLEDTTVSLHTFDFEPTQVSMSYLLKQQVVTARNNEENKHQAIAINLSDQKVKIFNDQYISYSDLNSADNILIYEHESYDSLVIYYFDTDSSKTLPFIGSVDDIIVLDGKYLIFAALGEPFRIMNVVYDMVNDTLHETGTDLPFSYRLEPTYISEGSKYYLDVGTDIEFIDDLYEINITNGISSVSDIISVTRRGLADDSHMKKIKNDIFILNQEHLYVIQDESFVQLDEHTILKNNHQSYQSNAHGIYWAEKSDTIISFYNYRDGQKNTIGIIIDNPQIDLYSLQIRDFNEGEESIYINGRLGFESTSFLLRKEDNTIIPLETTSGNILQTSFYNDGYYYYNIAGWIHRIDEFGNKVNLDIEAPLVGFGSNVLHNGVIYNANYKGIYAIKNGDASLQLAFEEESQFNFFSSLGDILFLEAENALYALVDDEWIEINLANGAIRGQLGEHLLLVRESTGTNQIINRIFDLKNNELYDLPEEFNTLNIISTFDYQGELYVISSTRFFPDYEVKVFKTNESFTTAEEVLTFETFGRGLGAKFTDFGDEGLLYIGNKIFLMNDQLEFVEIEGVYGDTESVSTEENDGTFYFIALHPQKGRQVYNTLAFSKRVSTKDIVSNLISIFPNPTTDIINLENESTQSNYTIKIVDVRGNIIFSSDIHKNESIDVSQYAEGIYYLNLIGNDGQILGKGMFIRG